MLKRLLSAWNANSNTAPVRPQAAGDASPPRPVEPPDYAPPGPGVSIERSFSQNGFALVPQAFAPDEIAVLRRAAIALYPNNRPPYEAQFSAMAPFAEPFRNAFSNLRLTAALRRLMGDDFTYINECSIHDSNFASWHTDTTSPEAKGDHEFHWLPTYITANVGIYFSDNLGSGSGLDVVPGSHWRDDPLAIKLRRDRGLPDCHILDEDRGDPYRNAVTIRGRGGDVVIFHTRIRHRSSVPVRPACNESERKLVLFLAAGANNSTTRRYRAWLDEYDKINGTQRQIVPDDFRAFLAGHGLTIL